MARRPAQVLLAVLVVLSLAGSAARSAPLAPSAPAVRLDVSGARDALALLQALGSSGSVDEQQIHRLLATRPYQVLLEYHSRLDSTVTADGLAEMLGAVQRERLFVSRGQRLGRMHAYWRWATSQLPLLQARLGELSDPAVVERAAARARSALPPYACLQVTVYVLADGYTPAYSTGDAIVLDLLQIARTDRLETWLARELHRIGVYSLFPEPCPDRNTGAALDVLAGMIQEGATSYWIDGWRARPRSEDVAQVQAFLEGVLEGAFSPSQAEEELAKLLAEGRGPLQRVGNRVIAALVSAYGDEWVQARLWDPVGLLRSYARLRTQPDMAALLALFRGQRRKCPAWF
ncbi:MAG: hypothetical protein K6V36_14170 [Anaerolineae bacterium]|nr:hypothetical protein [Anaerolineae bacterium]